MTKELCRDLVGKSVRLKREIKTRGGDVFPSGLMMVVYSTHRGRFTLDDPTKQSRGSGWVSTRSVSKVERSDFEIIL